MARIVFCSALPQEIQFLGRRLGIRIPGRGPVCIEHAIPGGPVVTLAVSGIGRERMSRLLSALNRQPVDLWISVGFAGGLDPHLRTGDLLEGTAVRTAEGDLGSFSKEGRLEKASSSILYCSNRIISTPLEKRELYEQAGAAAVDMESAEVAKHARSRGEPFTWIRVISDTAEEGIPPVLPQCIGANGFPSARAALRVLIKHPLSLPLLLRHARRSRRCGRLLADRALPWLERFET